MASYEFVYASGDNFPLEGDRQVPCIDCQGGCPAQATPATAADGPLSYDYDHYSADAAMTAPTGRSPAPIQEAEDDDHPHHHQPQTRRRSSNTPITLSSAQVPPQNGRRRPVLLPKVPGQCLESAT